MRPTNDDAISFQRVRENPASWMEKWFGADLWDQQITILNSVRDHRRTAVRSCHGVGKSWTCARIILWFLHAYPSSVVISTAPTGRQVRNVLWREINTAVASAKLPLLGRPLVERYEIAPDWYALGFKADDAQPDQFQGFHAQHALVVVDEAAGVPDSVFEALDAVMSSEDARMLLPGNPTNPQGVFYDAFHKDRDLYNTIKITAADTPNMRAGHTVRPYLITQQWIDEVTRKHGEDSPYVISRVHADFPSLTEAGLIPLAWIERCANNDVEEVHGPVEAGLDIARGGGDENSLCVRQGPKILKHVSWAGEEAKDLMKTVGRVRRELAPWPELSKIKIDVIGIGAGVVDRLRELDYPVVPINVGAASKDTEAFRNLRCELYWQMREIFHDGRIVGPIDDLAIGQFSNIRMTYMSNWTMPVIEDKDQTRKRLRGRSPDRAEAILLAFTNPDLSGGSFYYPDQEQDQEALTTQREQPILYPVPRPNGRQTLLDLNRGWGHAPDDDDEDHWSTRTGKASWGERLLSGR